MVNWDRLRYRLLPYIYSLAGAVTQDGGTMMRPLVMDFSFPGMLARRSFELLFIYPERPVGFSFELRPDRTVSYVGEELRIGAP